MLRMVAILALLLVAAGAIAFALSRSEDDPTVEAPSSDLAATEGLLVKVEPERLIVQPQSGGGQEVFALRPLDRGRLDLVHLNEHVKQRWPVRVIWESADGTRYAIRVDDA